LKVDARLLFNSQFNFSQYRSKLFLNIELDIRNTRRIRKVQNDQKLAVARFENENGCLNLGTSPGGNHLFSTRQFEQPHIVTENTILERIDEIRVYPNPANDFIRIESPYSIDQAYLYSIHGSLIKQISAPEKSATINLTSLRAGTYILKINSQSFSKTVKIIKREAGTRKAHALKYLQAIPNSLILRP